MADPVYGPGGTGYYTDPATGRRYWQTRYEYGPDAYDARYDSTLVYDPATAASDGSGSPNAGTVTPGTAPTNATTTPTQPNPNSTVPVEQNSARARARAILEPYGLGALADWYYDKLISGEPDAQIMLELRATPEYKARFPGMDALSAKGRAISEAEYINVEQQYVSLFRQAGLPAGFYDSPEDFGNFIANEVSPQEMAGRLDVARTALYETPPQVRDELSRLYGLGAGDVMAFLLDPTKALPVLKQQLTAAEAGYAAQASGWGMLTRGEGEQLGYADRTFDQLTQGFDELARNQELFTPIIGETDQDIVDRSEQLAAEFGGNMAARRRIEQRARQRVAAFQGGGGFAESQQGVSGLGSAAT